MQQIRHFLGSHAAMLVACIGLVSCGGSSGGGAVGSAETSSWNIPANEVVDGGPGQDGIPAIDNPQYVAASETSNIPDDEYVIALRANGQIKAYSHNILNWHEVVNDSADSLVTSYCPLTGSAVAWRSSTDFSNKEFGVSGLLYNSNLILYDRATGSRWSQMLERSVWGSRAAEIPEKVQVIETKFSTLRTMYPSASVLSRDTELNRNYDVYPYGDYRTSTSLLFRVAHQDNRLHPKTRVIGIRESSGGNQSKVFQLDGFGSLTQTINDQFDDQSIVVVGNSQHDIAAIYSRELADGTILTFSPLQDQLPNIMTDDEGNLWDIFGQAVSGPRAGTQLDKTSSFTAFWFAWTAFFPNAEIHFN